MTRWSHKRRVCSPKRLATLAAMRAAKERKRLERIAAGWTPEPKPGRKAYPLEIGFRDASSQEAQWTPLKSARQARRLAAGLLRHWTPTPKPFARFR
jgi:hypothetical protein